MFEPASISYDFAGFNLRKPMFQDVNTRKAIAHLIDVDLLIEQAVSGYGQRINSFSHPSKKDLINKDLVPYEYDLEKAKEYLKKGGWEDTNGDGIVEKEIDGKRVDFSFSVVTNEGNERRFTACQLFAENAQKIGINMKPEMKPWAEFIPMIRGAQFEMMVLG